MEHSVDLLCDGQLDLHFGGEVHQCGSGLHALRNHFHLGEDFGNRASFAKLNANVAVTAQ